MTVSRLIILVILFSIALPADARNRLREANQPEDIASSDLWVTPMIDWNRLGHRPGRGRSTEIWTIDGPPLNKVTFYVGIRDDETLFDEVDRRNRPLPRFSSTMLLLDIPNLLENSYLIGRGVTLFSVENAEPTEFADQPGVRFEYRFAASDQVRRRGEAYAMLYDEELYLVTYEAPTIYYFDNSIDAFRQLIASATLEDD